MTTGTFPPPNTEKSPNNEHISKNASSTVSAMIDQSDTYDRRIARAETIKVVNTHYSTPVTLEFTAVTKERNISIAQKHVIIFAPIKLLEPTVTIKSSKVIVYHHSKDFLCSQTYQDDFEVIVDKTTHPKSHIYVKHIIKTTL